MVTGIEMVEEILQRYVADKKAFLFDFFCVCFFVSVFFFVIVGGKKAF